MLQCWFLFLCCLSVLSVSAAKANCRRDSTFVASGLILETQRFICHQKNIRHLVSYRSKAWIQVTSFLSSSVSGDLSVRVSEVVFMTKVYLYWGNSDQVEINLNEDSWSLKVFSHNQQGQMGRLSKAIPLTRHARQEYPNLVANFSLSNPKQVVMRSEEAGGKFILKLAPESTTRLDENSVDASEVYSLNWAESYFPFAVAVAIFIFNVENVWYEYGVNPAAQLIAGDPPSSPNPSMMPKTEALPRVNLTIQGKRSEDPGKLRKSVSWDPHVKEPRSSRPSAKLSDERPIRTSAMGQEDLGLSKKLSLTHMYARNGLTYSTQLTNYDKRLAQIRARLIVSPTEVAKRPLVGAFSGSVQGRSISPSRRYPKPDGLNYL